MWLWNQIVVKQSLKASVGSCRQKTKKVAGFSKISALIKNGFVTKYSSGNRTSAKFDPYGTGVC